MSYAEKYTLSKDEKLVQRITAALADVADDVYAEPGSTPNHDLRLALVAYAGPIGSAYYRFAQEMALQLITTTGIVVDTNDVDLKTAIAQLWTPYALLMEARGTISVEEEPVP